jgi:hypothetical protein
MYGLSLEVMDRIQANFPAIDLGDKKAGVAFQVTVDKSGAKIQQTLNTFVTNRLSETYPRLLVLIIGRRQGQYKALTLPSGFRFDPETDVIDTGKLAKDAEKLDTPELQRLAAIFGEELKSPGGALEIVEASFVEDGRELRDPNELWYYRLLSKGTDKEAEFLRDWAKPGKLHAGEIPMIEVMARNTSEQPVVIKAAIFHVKQA